MIEDAEFIDQPLSGEYPERIYDNESAWNSQGWTFIKFVNADSSEWCGNFRGFFRQVAVSKVLDTALILTSNYLYQIDRKTGDLLDLEESPRYINLTVTPDGQFVLADYYNLDRISSDIKNPERIEGPIQMDMIQFEKWYDGRLKFTCDEFMNWDRHLTMIYNCETNKIEIQNG